jgi:putative phosphoesterase
MRVALLADIHGNDLALSAVLTAVRGAGIELLLIAGDLVGYYFAPDRVIDMLRPWKKQMVRGNHEDMLALARQSPQALERIDQQYGSGHRLALERLPAADLAELLSLPATASVDLDGCRLLLCHGAPWDTNQYVYPDAPDELLERCAAPDCAAVVMGHTHYPMVREAKGVRLLNPGSVGQPRNRRPGADWAIYDTGSGEVTQRHEAYDPTPLVEEAKARHPGIPYLHEVLVRL